MENKDLKKTLHQIPKDKMTNLARRRKIIMQINKQKAGRGEHGNNG